MRLWLTSFFPLLAAALAAAVVASWPGHVHAAPVLRAYDDSFEDGTVAVLQQVDPDDGLVSVPPEFAGCPSGANPPNTVFSVSFTSGLTVRDGMLHGLEWDGGSGPDIFLYTLASDFCATGTRAGEAPVGVTNLESLAWCPDEAAFFSAGFSFAGHEGAVVRIDPETGTGRQVGAPLPRDVRVVGMAHDDARGMLLAVTSGFGARPAELWSVVPSTGEAVLIGETKTAPNVLESLAWLPGDPPRLLAGGDRLYELDPGTGEATAIGGSPNGTLWSLTAFDDCGPASPDSDGDGTPDCDDACPDDPGKTEPGACDCGEGDDDSDGDGTPDCDDACPDDPGKTEPGACGCGEVDDDSDGDGTPDCDDACPDDPGKTEPGACGCGEADDDSDGDGTPDCDDACPDDPGKTEPGACGCGEADDDSDGDGTPDCDDACPDDPGKTEPGACGCGEADDDTDGDGTPDCEDACPGDPDKTEPGDCGCGEADEDADGDGLADCRCPHGDVHPEGAGDGAVTLADWVLARRKVVTGSAEIVAHDLACGDTAPSTLACTPEGGPPRRCVRADGELDLEDLAAIRARVAGTVVLSCVACPTGATAAARDRRLPGDVSPPGGDGTVDVRDVVQLLRWSVGLGEGPDEEGLLRGDVAPFDGGDVAGDGSINVNDVVAALRASVGLDELRWPAREVEVRSTEVRDFVALIVTLDGWPAWAEIIGFHGPACDGDAAAGLDSHGPLCAITCATDPTSLAGPTAVFTIRYRAPDPVELGGLDAASTLAAADLRVTEGGVTLHAD